MLRSFQSPCEQAYSRVSEGKLKGTGLKLFASLRQTQHAIVYLFSFSFGGLLTNPKVYPPPSGANAYLARQWWTTWVGTPTSIEGSQKVYYLPKTYNSVDYYLHCPSLPDAR